MKYAVRLYFLVFFLSAITQNLVGQSSESQSNPKVDLTNIYKDSLVHFFIKQDFDSTEYYTLKAKKLFQELGDEQEVILMMNNLSTIAFEKEEFGKSIDLQDSVFNLVNKIDKTSPIYFDVLINTIASKRTSGDYNKAKAIGQTAIKVEPDVVFGKESIRDQKKASLFEHLSFVHSFTGDYENAMKYSNLALQFKEKSLGSNSWALGSSYYSLALVYSKKGNYPQAIKIFQKALDAFDQNKKAAGFNRVINTQLRLAETFIKNQQIDKAKNIIDDLKEKEDRIKGYYKGDYYYLLAFYNLSLENPNSIAIEDYLTQSNNAYYKNLINSKNDFKISRNLNLLSSHYQNEEKYKMAEKLCFAALDSLGYSEFNIDTRQILNKASIIQILEDLFKISKLNADKELSIKVATEINELSQSLLFENSDERNKLYWSERNLPLYNQLIEHFIEVEDITMAFNLIEANKSNLLINDLNAHLASGLAGVETKLLDREKSIRSKISYLRKMIRKQNNENIVKSIEEDLLQEQNNLNALIDSIEILHPNLFQLKYKSDFTLTQLQSSLHAKTCLVEFFISTKNIYAILVSKNSTELVSIPFSQEIKSEIEKYYSSVSNKEEALSDTKKICNETYRILFKPINDFLKKDQFENVLIVADDFLNNIPFESLIDENGDYLGLNYNFSYQYSAKLALLLASRKSKNQPIDFLGYAYESDSHLTSDTRSCLEPEKVKLICSSKEIEEISNIIGSKKLDTLSNSTNELFEKATKAKILHLATHACADPQNPNLSTIYFNNDQMSSLDVQLKEINSDLVVLSACESGYGKVFKGEGTMSLSKSFFHAGAKSTLVSLWPVDDCTTSELMKYFYQSLNEGQNKHEALKNAKKTYLANTHPNTSKPYYWAGFVLIGDSSPVWTHVSFKSKLILGFVLFLLVVILIFLFKKGK